MPFPPKTGANLLHPRPSSIVERLGFLTHVLTLSAAEATIKLLLRQESNSRFPHSWWVYEVTYYITQCHVLDVIPTPKIDENHFLRHVCHFQKAIQHVRWTFISYRQSECDSRKLSQTISLGKICVNPSGVSWVPFLFFPGPRGSTVVVSSKRFWSYSI